jgi:hypothetical protein
VSVGIGRAVPAGQSAFDSGTLIGINFARRYTRNIQADLGLQTSFNTDYRRFEPRTGAGLTTNTYFVPLGGRIVVPLWADAWSPPSDWAACTSTINEPEPVIIKAVLTVSPA